MAFIGQTVASLVVLLGADISDYRRKMREAENDTRARTKAIEQHHSRMSRMMQAQLIVAGAALVRMAISAAKASLELNEGMANVATLIPGNIERVKELRQEVQNLAIYTGKASADITSGLYQTISAFQDGADTMKILSIGAEMAMAGLSSTREAINLLIPATKGFGDVSAEAAQKAADLAFMTVKLGVTTIPELAASFGHAAALAKALGVQQEELWASYATLTGVTGDTAEVTTQLTAIMRAFIKPTDAMKASIKALNYENAQAIIQELGLVDAFRAVVKTTDGSAEGLAKLFERTQGLTAAFYLLSDEGIADFSKKLDAMRQSAGAANQALREVTEGINKEGHALNVAKAEAKTFMEDIGGAFVTLGVNIALGTREWIRFWDNMYGASQAKKVKEFEKWASELGYLKAPEFGIGFPEPTITQKDVDRAKSYYRDVYQDVMDADKAYYEHQKTLQRVAREAEIAAEVYEYFMGIVQKTASELNKPILINSLYGAATAAEKLKWKLLDVGNEYEKVPELVIVSAEAIEEFRNQAERAAAYSTNAIMDFYSAVKQGESVFASLGNAITRFAEDAIFDFLRMKMSAWWLSYFSGGNVKYSASGDILPTSPTNSFKLDNYSPVKNSNVSVTLNNTSGIPLQAGSANVTRGAGGSMDIEVIVEGAWNKLANTGKLDKTMRANYGLYRQAG